MLLQLIAQKPQMLGTVIAHTPAWVWGLLAALLALGLSQVRGRTVGLRRVTFMPLAMTGLSLWGAVSAFGSSPQIVAVLLAWAAAAAVTLAFIASMPAPAGTGYDATSRSFTMPGSWVPLALIVGIFLTKYVAGVDLAMQPSLARDGQYTLVVATIYGAFSGIFAGRAARLWRLALRPSASHSSTVTA
ncbi:MAG: hypothetical protein JWQ33_991 [Ramlibacter sp.]|nr:hypothetical protein [Ramlibacter sp.]